MRTKAMVLLIVATMGVSSVAMAGLTTIGTATYNGSSYNLIWDNDSSLIWLDYSNSAQYWANQMAWATGLGSQLTYNIDSAYTVTWTETAWRLPSAGDDPAYGCQAATQEMGHLYYDELGFTGGSSDDGVTAPDLAGSIFENLVSSGYWTCTAGETLDLGFLGTYETAWAFFIEVNRNTPYNDTVYGFQDIDATGSGWISCQHYGVAVRGAEVAGGAAIPVPGAALLAGIGASCVGWLRRRRAF